MLARVYRTVLSEFSPRLRDEGEAAFEEQRQEVRESHVVNGYPEIPFQSVTAIGGAGLYGLPFVAHELR